MWTKTLLFSAFVLALIGCKSGNQDSASSGSGSSASTKHGITASSEAYNFGSNYLTSLDEAVITVTNDGESIASEISGLISSSHFEFKGGAFPGEGGTCTGDLPVEGSCTVVIRVTSNDSGEKTAVATIQYKSNQVNETLKITLSAVILPGAGSLDTTFNTTGWTSIDFPQGIGNGTGGVSSSGNIYAVGHAINMNNFSFDFVPMKFDETNGADTAFDGDGWTMVDFNNNGDFGTLAGTQSNGKLIAGGFSVGRFLLARLNFDGSLDTSFNTDGKVSESYSGSSLRGLAMHVQSDDKILMGSSINDKVKLMRVNADGGLDTSFDGDGWVLTNPTNKVDGVTAITTQADGKILVAGYKGTSDEADWMVLRYLANGTLDTTFDGDGIFTRDFNGKSDATVDIRVQSDGKILVLGSVTTADGSTSKLGVIRLHSDGSLDTDFATSGILLREMENLSLANMVVQANDSFVIGGNYDQGPFLTRYDRDGALDTSYGTDGTQALEYEAGNLQNIQLQADGKVVVFSSAGTQFCASRHLAEPASL